MRLITWLRAFFRSLITPVLAIILIFEEWGWKPLLAAMNALARFKLINQLESLIQRAPPYVALFLFVLPSLVLIPAKLFALWLAHQGQLFFAGLVFVTAKIIGTALLARLFQLTQSALMKISWFKAIYDRFKPWKDALFEHIRQTKVWRIGRMMKHKIKNSLLKLKTKIWRG